MSADLTLPLSPPTIDCDLCVAPGACCKAFPLGFRLPVGSSIEAIKAKLEEYNLPFEPLRRFCILNGDVEDRDRVSEIYNLDMWRFEREADFFQEEWTGAQELWLFSCPKLLPNGRCGIYENRPSTCKEYEPGCDSMCVHMRGPDGYPIVPLKERI